MRQRELIIDSFAGGGGASLGIEWATGRSPDVAINHDAAAIEMHTRNHPATRHYKEDVFRVNPREVTRGRPVGLLHLSPDCFPAGTMILTDAGYKAIESVQVGDMVLTHKNRWRVVTSTMTGVKAIRTVRGHGHPGLAVSDEHPFFASHRTNEWDNAGRRYKPVFTQADWVKAYQLLPLVGKEKGQSGHYWATPTTFEPLPIPTVGGRGLNLDENAWWLIGRYLADGWSRIDEGRAELVLVCGEHKVREMRRRLDAWDHGKYRAGDGELTWGERVTKTARQFSTNHRGLVEWLRLHFGHLAHNKVLPGWVLGMDVEHRRSLLSGYTAGDGYDDGNMIQATTTSPALAYGVKSLAASLGHTVSVHEAGPGGKAVIEGREVNTRPSLHVHWRHEVCPDHKQTFDAGGHRFSPIREITSAEKTVPVFNLSVEEDESYIVEGIVVHNCTHFSRAKGGKPVKKSIRGLAWVAIQWAVEASPRVIILENVREFQDWGPLVSRWVCRAGCGWKGTESQTTLVRIRRRCPRCESLRVSPTEDMVPCPDRKGLTFKRFVGRLKGCGYDVAWKVLNAADFGAPTHRRRLFLVARNDGEPINWPEPTHGDPKKIGKDLFSGDQLPWRTAAECIDWSIPCPSIFDRKKPLAEKTLKRIALGIKRYVLDNPKPFIVDMQRENRARGADEPAGTVTTQSNRFQVVVPTVVGVGGRSGQSPPVGGDVPVGTVTAKNDRAVVTPVLSRIGQVNANGSYANTPTDPLTTVTSKAEHLLITPVITPVTHAGERRANGPQEPLPTVTGANRGELAVIAPVLANLAHGDAKDGRCRGLRVNELTDPVGTVHAGGGSFSLIAPTLVQTGFGERDGQAPRALDLHKPLGTVAGTGKHALVSAFLAKHYGGVVGTPVDVPAGTVTAVDHHSVVAANLVHLNHGQDEQFARRAGPHRHCERHARGARLLVPDEILRHRRPVAADRRAAPHGHGPKARFGLVTVTIDGTEYVITDIGMRMLKPRELARAQGFPDSYILTGTATNQVERIGNSVSPPVERAVVEALGFTPAVRRKGRAFTGVKS